VILLRFSLPLQPSTPALPPFSLDFPFIDPRSPAVASSSSFSSAAAASSSSSVRLRDDHDPHPPDRTPDISSSHSSSPEIDEAENNRGEDDSAGRTQGLEATKGRLNRRRQNG
ncbi:hypothetical protein LINGRAPRIM_LOCUS3462, partial [Linum grandiflorum]